MDAKMDVACKRSKNTPVHDFKNILKKHPDQLVAWYVGKASDDLDVHGVCSKTSRQIRSFYEHLPIGAGHGNVARKSHHKILKETPKVVYTFFYPSEAESKWFQEIFKEIPACHPNLNIVFANGAADEHCYLHLYVGVEYILIHKNS